MGDFSAIKSAASTCKGLDSLPLPLSVEILWAIEFAESTAGRCPAEFIFEAAICNIALKLAIPQMLF
jgi:hypothetical protein